MSVPNKNVPLIKDFQSDQLAGLSDLHLVVYLSDEGAKFESMDRTSIAKIGSRVLKLDSTFSEVRSNFFRRAAESLQHDSLSDLLEEIYAVYRERLVEGSAPNEVKGYFRNLFKAFCRSLLDPACWSRCPMNSDKFARRILDIVLEMRDESLIVDFLKSIHDSGSSTFLLHVVKKIYTFAATISSDGSRRTDNSAGFIFFGYGEIENQFTKTIKSLSKKLCTPGPHSQSERLGSEMIEALSFILELKREEYIVPFLGTMSDLGDVSCWLKAVRKICTFKTGCKDEAKSNEARTPMHSIVFGGLYDCFALLISSIIKSLKSTGFPSPECKEALLILLKMGQSDLLEKLVSELLVMPQGVGAIFPSSIFELQDYAGDAQLARLAEARLKELTLKKPVATYRRPQANIVGHPKLTEFLQSDEESFEYRGMFPNMYNARQFIKVHFWDRSLHCNKYVAQVEPYGAGKQCYLKITKDLVVHKHEQQKYDGEVQEHEQLAPFLKKKGNNSKSQRSPTREMESQSKRRCIDQ